MDDIFKRLGLIEVSVTSVRSEVGVVRSELSSVLAIIPHLATKADLQGLEARMAAMETRITKWLVGTLLTCMTVASGATALIMGFAK